MDYLEYLGCDLLNDVRFELPNGATKKIEFSDEQRKKVVKKYYNFKTTAKIAENMKTSESVIKRILNEENVNWHSRKDWVNAGKINFDGLDIKDDLKNKILKIYRKTNNLSETCRKVGMENHYPAIRERINGRSDDPKDDGAWKVS